MSGALACRAGQVAPDRSLLPAASPFIALGSSLALRSVGLVTLIGLPVLELSRCNGCGACESVCLVRPRPAIEVVSAGLC